MITTGIERLDRRFAEDSRHVSEVFNLWI